MLRLVTEDDIRYNRDRYTIKCRLCESYETKIRSNGELIWIKDKNSRGEWTNRFLCYACAYEKDKSCHKCGSDADKYTVKQYDNSGLWTGQYTCESCRHRDIAEFRNGHIQLNIGTSKGFLGDLIIAKILEVPACSIYLGDLRLPFGLIHGYYGIIGVKIAKMSKGRWEFSSNGRISADTYFYLGFGEDYKNIEIVYIIPNEDMTHTNGRLYIHKNSKKYLKYKVDEKQYNDIYHEITNNVKIGNAENMIKN